MKPRHLLAAAALIMWAIVARLAWHTSLVPTVFGRYSGLYAAVLAVVLVIAVAVTAAWNWSRHHPLPRVRLLPAAIFMVWCLACSVIAIEVLVRTSDFIGASLYEEIGRYMEDLEPDPLAVYRQHANFRRVYQGVEVQTNELGLRERPLAPHSADRKRILLLGDSVTLGWGVAADRLFGRQMEILARDDGAEIETVNSGVCGYNTTQEFGALRRLVNPVRPDLVLLTYVDNDVDLQPADMNAMRQQWHAPRGAASTLLRWSWSYRLFFHLGPALLRKPVVNPDAPGWQASIGSLHDIAQFCRARNIPLAVLFFRLTPGAISDAIDARVRQAAAADMVPYADALPWFRNVSARTVTNSLVDSHPNAAGHEIVARAYLDLLTRNGLLTPGLAPPSAKR